MAVDYVGKEALSFEKGKELEPVAQVILNLGADDEGNEIVVKYPTTDPQSGRIVEYELPLITSATVAANIAQNLYNKLSGFTYKPFNADGAVLDPAMQLGDQVNVNGSVYGLGAIRTFGDHLYSADISAPMSEEEDHEYGIKGELSAGQIKRLVARTEASIRTTIDSITLSVIDTDGKITPASIVAAINGSSSSIKISADHVSISGFVEFSDLSTAGRTTINGANIVTGTLEAEKIKAGTLNLGNDTIMGILMLGRGALGDAFVKAVDELGGYGPTLALGSANNISISCLRTIVLSSDDGVALPHCYGTELPSTTTPGWNTNGAVYFKV